MPKTLSRLICPGVLLWALSACVHAQAAASLPPSVVDALKNARVPSDALSVVVQQVQPGHARLKHQAEVPRNPASLLKLVTTTAALDVLGTTYTWRTPVYIDGALRDGVLHGNLYLQGSGDPRLGVEQLWLLLRRVQGLGIQQVQGDIVLDRSVFTLAPTDPGGFDGEPLRPYNAAPDGLLVNFKSLLLQFVPDPANKLARVHAEPPLAGVKLPTTVPLSNADCADYRGGLKADFSNPLNISFNGSYPLACGEKTWPLAYADPPRFAMRAVHGMWLQLGGQLSGAVRDGTVPAGLKPVLFHESPTLAEVVRDINKFSNNVMAEQVFLTLSAQQRPPGTYAQSTDTVLTWWRERLPGLPVPQLDKGSGLSRETRISAQSLAGLLQWAWMQSFMPELAASLPVTGLDGTMKRSKSSAVAHLKTGSLRDVMGIAGYVDAANGQRYVLVAIVNHANAHQARPVMDALIDWTAGKP
jgi:D-alanyl-D-alanine carboxypeptidase/D-alanyl-D-alanine-endopeptidase (penicillin-binding protein 4)